jgi:hypothetical protein
MKRVLLRVRDKNQVSLLSDYGSVTYVSPVINLVGMTIEDDKLYMLQSDQNVLQVDIVEDGSFLAQV